MKKIAVSTIVAIASYSILLTFDDGPNPLYTDQLLTPLKVHNLKALFLSLLKKR